MSERIIQSFSSQIATQTPVTPYLAVEQSPALEGEANLLGAKNATLVIMTSLILTKGVSVLRNVPASEDVINMIQLFRDLGASVQFDSITNVLEVDTRSLEDFYVASEMMKKMRASVLVMGPLLARFGKAKIGFPGGDLIGARPLDYHLTNFEKMGVVIEERDHMMDAHTQQVKARNLLLEYPSVGATENLLMFATLTPGTTRIINAALEPEVFDLVTVLKRMGARVQVDAPATITIIGVKDLKPVDHTIMFDRMEAAALLSAGAITGGYVHLPQGPAHAMGMLLMKFQEMGHTILIHPSGTGIKIKATKNPQAVHIKTAPYPGFATDMQAYMVAILALAQGTSRVQETVFENRLMHAKELSRMGAQIDVVHDTALIRGVERLYGEHVIASDIRASCALVLAGLVAEGQTTISGVHHWKRGYQGLEDKLCALGANVKLHE